MHEIIRLMTHYPDTFRDFYERLPALTLHAVMQSQAHLGVRQRPGDSQVLKQRYLHFQQVHGRSPRSLLVQSLDGLQTSDTGQMIPRWQ